jgi:hypothetical protein
LPVKVDGDVVGGVASDRRTPQRNMCTGRYRPLSGASTRTATHDSNRLSLSVKPTLLSVKPTIFSGNPIYVYEFVRATADAPPSARLIWPLNCGGRLS